MKHVCVAAEFDKYAVDNAKRGAADIAHTATPRDKVSSRAFDKFGCNPSGWHYFSPIYCVVFLANVLDIGFVALLDLSENRDSARRRSLC